MPNGIPDAQINVMPGRSLPVPVADGARPMAARGGHWGEQYALSLVPTKHLLAEEESFWTVTNPTIGTGVAHAILTAFADTNSLFVVQNTWDPSDPLAKSLYLDCLELFATNAPTACVSLEFAIKLDKALRTPTAGSAALVPVITDSGSGRAVQGLVHAFSGAAQTVPASSASARTTDRIKMPIGLNVTGDCYRLQFGAADMPGGTPPLTAIRAAQPATFTAYAAPCRIRPGHFAVIYRWGLTEATSAPSYEYRLSGWER